MNLLGRPFSRMFTVPLLTRGRVRAAYVAAVTADALQLILGPFGWIVADQVIDVAAMFVISRLLGFHPLLLPTFALELVPMADMLPTWTACVALVVTMRQRQQPATPGAGTVIDV